MVVYIEHLLSVLRIHSRLPVLLPVSSTSSPSAGICIPVFYFENISPLSCFRLFGKDVPLLSLHKAPASNQ